MRGSSLGLWVSPAIAADATSGRIYWLQPNGLSVEFCEPSVGRIQEHLRRLEANSLHQVFVMDYNIKGEERSEGLGVKRSFPSVAGGSITWFVEKVARPYSEVSVSDQVCKKHSPKSDLSALLACFSIRRNTLGIVTSSVEWRREAGT